MAYRILAWNCRGIAGICRRRALIDLIRQEKPRILFLSETLCDDKQMETLRLKVGFDNCIGWPKGNGARGVAMLWMNDVPLHFRNYSARHVDVTIGDRGSAEEWRLTGIYGFAQTGDRPATWALMRTLAAQSSLPWILCGDFNEIMHSSEKSGGGERRLGQIQAFRECAVDCSLMDMGYVGSPYTWSDYQTKERLDRSLWNVGLRALFSHSTTRHLHPSSSDHSPLLIEMCNSPSTQPNRRKKLFRFEQYWAQHNECEGIIKTGWQGDETGDPMSRVCSKIRRTGSGLMAWQRTTFQFRQIEMKAVRERLDELLQAPFDPTLNQEKQELNSRLQELLTQEETIWSQRSKEMWLNAGDRNTAYFHRRASNRRQRNTIKGLRDETGQWVTEQVQIEHVVSDYYRKMFSSEGTNGRAMELILNTVSPKVTHEMNQELLASYTDDEIRAAAFQMHPSKSPGPDGMSPFFFQKFWDTVGGDVCNAVRSYLTSGTLIREVNFTHITLIPKVKEPKEMSELRPIALCNVLYRICSKVLANRLKRILGKVISPLQSAFVPGRLISDNTLVATEVAHFLHTDRRVGNEHFSLKLDISKAYDRLEWSFLHRMLLKLGFAEEWVEVVMAGIQTVSYSFLVNGEVRGYVRPTRGIRQGDPLSPYLFILCAEGLSSLIEHFVRQRWIKGIQIAPTAPILHHLLFADDSFLFGHADEEECQQFRSILHTYEIASGQRVNLQKSSVAFSKNVGLERQEALATILGVQRVDKHDRYLGLPTHVGKGKTAAFAYLKEKLTKKVVSWRSKLLSGAGKEILIKAVGQSIPMYVMNCYKLPVGLCDDLHQLCAGFWWGDSEEKNKIHWRSWERLCVPKQDGGMGFKNLHWFNLAMLAKQSWRLLQNPDSLIAKLYKAIYFPIGEYGTATIGTAPSFSWRSIREARQVLLQGLRWQVGDGSSIEIWNHNWIPDTYPRCPSSPPPRDAPKYVSELIDTVTWSWNVDLLHRYFTQADIDLILNIPLSRTAALDKQIWHFNKKGIFTTNSAYYVARDLALGLVLSPQPPIDPLRVIWKTIWKAKVPGKVALNAWRIAADILPTRWNLSRKGYDGDMGCALCNHDVEDSLHLFINCSYANDVWNRAGLQWSNGAATMHECLVDTLPRLNKEDVDKVLMLLWGIWKNRNSEVWEQKSKHASETFLLTLGWYEEFKKSNARPVVRCRPSVKWARPIAGQFKMNCDGAYIASNRRGGAGCVLRNNEGEFLAGTSRPHALLTSPFHAELLALKEGLRLAQTLQYTEVTFESDCALLVQALQQEDQDLSTMRLLIDEIKSLLQGNPGFQVTHVQREANTVAHLLASHALRNSDSQSWFAQAPDIIRDAIRNEYTR